MKSKIVILSYVGGFYNLNFEIYFCVYLFYDILCRKKNEIVKLYVWYFVMVFFWIERKGEGGGG